MSSSPLDNDVNAHARKLDHINLAFQSQIHENQLDKRFYYEPLAAGHPTKDDHQPLSFLGKTFRAPLWVSSMTGGTQLAKTINQNLAQACGQFGFGMGLGSCRALLTEDTYLPDFDVRHLMGENLPLYANLGIAQVEKLLQDNKLHLIDDLLQKLKADGLIVHINPLQEWLQPEGDHIKHPPLYTLKQILDKKPNLKIIVKEVGSGFGPASMADLLQLPIEAIDFGANGGTNFAMIELLRNNQDLKEQLMPLTQIGHSATEMLAFTNFLIEELGNRVLCKQIIISGGVKNFLDGYYLTQNSSLPSVYAHAASFLQHAQGPYASLEQFVNTQLKGLAFAQQYLRVKPLQ
jgi:isopentenyl-diphosphate delta-isomerase